MRAALGCSAARRHVAQSFCTVSTGVTGPAINGRTDLAFSLLAQGWASKPFAKMRSETSRRSTTMPLSVAATT